MKIKQPRITHIQKMRTKNLMQRITIQSKCELSELEHNTLVYETGIDFLTDLYQDFDENQVTIQASDKKFWSWWKSEWMLWDSAYLNGSSRNINKIGYEQFVRRAARHLLTATGYQSFIKSLK